METKISGEEIVMSEAQELTAAAKQMREDAAWPSENLALAVAEWLETEAHMVERRGNSAEGHTFHALKVARAYLVAEPTGSPPA